MKTRAAVAFEAGKELEIEMLDLEGPKAGEVLVRNVASGVCHTDAFTLSGEDPEGLFPAVLGHEGGAVVEEVGAGVTSVSVGDHVIPLYTPECGECSFCTSGKTNLCQAIRATQGQGLMPDGTSPAFGPSRSSISISSSLPASKATAALVFMTIPLIAMAWMVARLSKAEQSRPCR